MRGRYGHYRSKMDYETALAKASGLALDPDRGPPEIPSNYNVSPTQAAWIARSQEQKSRHPQPVGDEAGEYDAGLHDALE